MEEFLTNLESASEGDQTISVADKGTQTISVVGEDNQTAGQQCHPASETARSPKSARRKTVPFCRSCLSSLVRSIKAFIARIFGTSKANREPTSAPVTQTIPVAKFDEAMDALKQDVCTTYKKFAEEQWEKMVSQEKWSGGLSKAEKMAKDCYFELIGCSIASCGKLAAIRDEAKKFNDAANETMVVPNDKWRDWKSRIAESEKELGKSHMFCVISMVEASKQ